MRPGVLSYSVYGDIVRSSLINALQRRWGTIMGRRSYFGSQRPWCCFLWVRSPLMSFNALTHKTRATALAAALTLLLVIAILPSVMLHVRTDTLYPPPLYSLLAIPAALVSLAGFAFMIALSTIAKMRFQSVGIDAAYGPLVCSSVCSLTHPASSQYALNTFAL